MLLNEFLKDHRKVEEQSSEIAQLKAGLAQLKSALKAQTTRLDQVDAKVAVEDTTWCLVLTNE